MRLETTNANDWLTAYYEEVEVQAAGHGQIIQQVGEVADTLAFPFMAAGRYLLTRCVQTECTLRMTHNMKCGTKSLNK